MKVIRFFKKTNYNNAVMIQGVRFVWWITVQQNIDLFFGN